MTRNFTQESQEKVIQLFTALKADDNDQIADRAQQLRGKYSRLLSFVGGSELFSFIMADNRQTAAIKRSAQQSFLAAFDSMSALDTPFGQTTSDNLEMLQTAIAAISYSFGAYDDKLNGRYVRYTAIAGMSDMPLGDSFDADMEGNEKAALDALLAILINNVNSSPAFFMNLE